MSDEIKVIEVDPSTQGWILLPFPPRTWLLPGGTYYTFPPGVRQVLLVRQA